ncbi:MAG: undecaprenyl-diphosphate phosphatase [Kiritimatiellia bacterium]
METFFKIMVLAVVQGLTEFLPVSSSGHLVLAKHFLGLKSPGASLELFLHGGTLLAIVVYYRRKLLALLLGVFRGERAALLYALWVLVSMVPAGVMYAWKGEAIERCYGSPLVVSVALIVTGLALLSLHAVERREPRQRPFGWFDALLMGVFQMIAMFPGVSRSGSTIFIARLMGVKPADAAEFSFVMSLPVIGGAVLVEIVKDGVSPGGLNPWHCLAGAVVAAVVGWLAIGGLIRLLGRGRFHRFGFYCGTVGLLSLVLLLLGGC